MNGTGMRRLTTAAGEDDKPAWSPDGNVIAFHSDGRDVDRLTDRPSSGDGVADWMMNRA